MGSQVRFLAAIGRKKVCPVVLPGEELTIGFPCLVYIVAQFAPLTKGVGACGEGGEMALGDRGGVVLGDCGEGAVGDRGEVALGDFG
jgi:hypothetical protein